MLPEPFVEGVSTAGSRIGLSSTSDGGGPSVVGGARGCAARGRAWRGLPWH